MIFKEDKYESYQEYVEIMKDANERIDEFDKRVGFDTCVYFNAKHNILSLDLYNFIIELRRLYNENK